MRPPFFSPHPAVERRAPVRRPLRRREPPAARPQPRLSPDDLATLRRLAALSHHVLHLLVDAAGLRETRNAAYTLADELAAWHRRHEPEFYGRERGDRP